MRLLIVDGLNFFMHKFPAWWTWSFDIIKAELDMLASACAAADVMPLIILDLYKSGSVGQQKWRRRQRKLLVRNRAIPCSASCLIGTILAETGMAWSYATTVEADDLIISIAQQVEGCTVLSGDKGYIRTHMRTFCVARGCSYQGQLRFMHVTHADCCGCRNDVHMPAIRLQQNTAKMDFYMRGIRAQDMVYKGVFYTSFTILPCMWCFLQPLRAHLYYSANVESLDESHVCANMCQETMQLCWSMSKVHANHVPDFVNVCHMYVNQYIKISEKHQHFHNTDHGNACFACAVSVSQILTDLWYLDQDGMDMLDSLSVSRAFSRHLNMLLPASFHTPTDQTPPNL